jgi:hypothetical protein
LPKWTKQIYEIQKQRLNKNGAILLSVSVSNVEDRLDVLSYYYFKCIIVFSNTKQCLATSDVAKGFFAAACMSVLRDIVYQVSIVLFLFSVDTARWCEEIRSVSSIDQK